MAATERSAAAGGARPAGTILRPLKPADLPDVMQIERRSFTSPWAEATFRGLLLRPSASLTVAERDGRICGYLVIWFAGDEAELGDLAVAPELRRKGIGAQLVAHAVRLAGERGVRVLFLEVRTSNTAARRLYERAGFEVATIRRDYYVAPREDALLMRKAL